MNIFQSINNGDSATWDDSVFVDDLGKSYDSAVYTLKYELRGPASLTLNAIANGAGWRTALTTTQSATLTAGKYFWAAILSKTGERVTASTGGLTVNVDLVTQIAGFDGRTQAEKALADAETALATFISSKGRIKKYTIGSRSMEFDTAGDILTQISYWKMKVANEHADNNRANGLGDPRNLYVRFV